MNEVQFNQGEFNSIGEAVKYIYFHVIVNLSKNLTAQIIKTFNIYLTFAQQLVHSITITFNIIIKFGISIPASWFRLAWLKQINPDIKGFYIYMASKPYGNYTLVSDTISLVYLFGVVIGKRKWIKVVPYTDRGELKPLIIKSVRG